MSNEHLPFSIRRESELIIKIRKEFSTNLIIFGYDTFLITVIMLLCGTEINFISYTAQPLKPNVNLNNADLKVGSLACIASSKRVCLG